MSPSFPRWRQQVGPAYALGLAGLAVALQIFTPIIAFDTDLWYHLAHGRTMVTEGSIPATSYFSYLEPARQWVDYYWAFQATAYFAFVLAGYGGLLALRTVVFATLLLTVGRWLDIHRPTTWKLLLWAALILQFFPKAQLVRPHGVSFLCIAIFLWILERKRAWAAVLPAVAWVWVSFHGVEYPVLLLIVAAYGVDLFTGRQEPSERRRLLFCFLFCLGAIFLTPHGTRLLAVPFRSTELASHYLTELARPEIWELLSFSFSPRGMPTLTVVAFVFAASLLCAVGGLRKGQPSAPLILWLGGCFLLLRGFRFHHEFTLLSLPLLLRQGPPVLVSPRLAVRRMADLAVLLLMALPLVALWPNLAHRAELYPLSLRNLPHGAVSFLEQHGGGGRVMNPPNFGGYLQWELGAEYQIFMDMEVPFLFSDQDIYEISASFVDPQVLARILDRDHPTFIAAPKEPPGFAGLISNYPRFQPVFFDDLVVLYADRQQRPGLVARFGLRVVDPHALEQRSLADLVPEQRLAWIRELERIAAVDGRIVAVDQALAILQLHAGDAEAAGRYATAILERDRRIARGWKLRGDAWRSSGNRPEALAAYRRGLEVAADEWEERLIARSLASLLDEMEQPEAAYRALRRATGMFDPLASPVDLYNLAILAARTGRGEEAGRLLSWAALKVPPEDQMWTGRITEAQRTLEISGDPSGGSSPQTPTP